MADHCDCELLEPYDPSQKSNAQFKKIGPHLTMRMLLQSYLLYKNVVKNNMKTHKLMERLDEELSLT